MSQTNVFENIVIENLTSLCTNNSDNIKILQDIKITSKEVNTEEIFDSNILKDNLSEYLNFNDFDNSIDFIDINLFSEKFSDISDDEIANSSDNIKENILINSTESKTSLFKITKKKFNITKKSLAKLKSLTFYLNHMNNLKPTKQNFVRLNDIFNDFVSTL